ncbi:MAG: hypothetical protein JST80_03660 [Bdellovibrionales bacterium]|nr:hypothetical protein [Bdellovibrionales bacterium]
MTTLIMMAMAASYRPYLECDGYKPRTHIEIKQNVTPGNGLALYSFNMTKKPRRQKEIQVQDLAAERAPNKRKNVIETIAVSNEKGIPDYELTVFMPETSWGFRSQLIDQTSTRTVYCYYHITR